MNQKRTSQNPVSMELHTKLLNLALEIAKGFGVKLDFSFNSIQKVEEVLGRIHEDYKKTKSEDGMNGIAIEFAAYLVEVINRHSDEKGVWYTDDSHFGEKTFPFEWKGDTMFLYSWCQKRIFDGKADDVYFKYQSIILPKLNEDEKDRGKAKKRFFGLFG